MQKRSRRSRATRRWTVGAVAATVAIAALAACGSDDDDDAAASQTSAVDTASAASRNTGATETSGTGEEPVPGGSLTYLHFVDIKGFDPAVSDGDSTSNIQNFALYGVLAHERPTGEVVLGLLESGESTDAVTWTLELRRGVEFSDGTALDAEAVKFNWERLADPETGAVAAGTAQSIRSIKVANPTTLEVVLKEPDSQFLRSVATTALTWIASPTAIRADPTGLNTQPVGAGPYLLKEWVPGSEAVFERNPSYYGTTYVDEFTVKVITDETQRLAALQSGEGDVMFASSPISAGQAEDAGFDCNAVAPGGGWVLFFNTQRAPFDDLKVRQAFALALDGQEMSDTVYDGNRAAATNMFPESSPFYDEGFDQPAADNAKAQALFDEIAEERGEPLEVTLSYIDPFADAAPWFQSKLAGFDNVTVKLEHTPISEFQTRYADGDVQFGFFSHSITDPAKLAEYVATDAPLNFSQVSDPEIDEALAKGAASLDEQERIDIYAPVLQKIVDEVPFTYVVRQEVQECYDADRVHGIGPNSQVSSSGFIKITEVGVTE